MIEWISVKDDTPKEQESVLAWVSGYHRSASFWDTGHILHGQWRVGSDWTTSLWLGQKVTHWSRVNAPKQKRQANRGRKA